MRSRFSAFALGLGAYLVRTLAADHPDRRVPEPDLVRELSRAKDVRRFVRLDVIFASSHADQEHAHAPSGHVDEGEVLFVAEIFERGVDVSFAELSDFRRERGAWRYASGILVPRARLPRDLRALTRDAFLEIAARAPDGG